MDGSITHRVDGLSKLTKINELRQMLIEKFEAEPEQQRLFYRGKQVSIWLVSQCNQGMYNPLVQLSLID